MDMETKEVLEETENQTEPGKETKKKTLLILILAICVLSVLIVGLVLVLLIPKETVEEKAIKLIETGDYVGAKTLLLGEKESRYDPELLVKCNLGILKQALSERGTHSNDGKRFYIKSGFGGYYEYFELTPKDELILGYELKYEYGSDDFKIFLSGSNTCYFEREEVNELSYTVRYINQRDLKSISHAEGTVDFSKSSSWTRFDNYYNKTNNNSSYEEVFKAVFAETESEFLSSTNKCVSQMINKADQILKENGLDITLKDLWCDETDL